MYARYPFSRDCEVSIDGTRNVTLLTFLDDGYRDLVSPLISRAMCLRGCLFEKKI